MGRRPRGLFCSERRRAWNRHRPTLRGRRTHIEARGREAQPGCMTHVPRVMLASSRASQHTACAHTPEA